MSARTVSTAIQQALNGKTYGTFGTVSAQTIYSPVVTNTSTHPQIWVIPDEGKESRWTAPRGGGGLKNMHHHVKLYIEAMFQPSSTTPLLSMRDLVEGVLGTLRTMAMPQVLTDAVTGRSWQLLSVGEYSKWIEPAPTTLATQRLIKHLATIRVSALESTQV